MCPQGRRLGLAGLGRLPRIAPLMSSQAGIPSPRECADVSQQRGSQLPSSMTELPQESKAGSPQGWGLAPDLSEGG